jgi:hypothetical protein
MAFDWGDFSGGLGSFLGGIFGDSGKPYDEAEKKYKEYEDKIGGINDTYINEGRAGVKNYREWLDKQKDPAKFINDMQDQYSESPYAHYLQQQSVRAGQNAASASGLSGSTPLMQQLQENAGAISSKDMNNWLQHVLGINTQYGEGENNVSNRGQHATDTMTNFYNNQADRVGEAEYGKNKSKNNDLWSTISGVGGMIGSFF